MIALVLLTCLRGWVGDAMAIEMSRMQSNAAIATTALADSAMQSGGMPCHGEGQNSAEQEPSSAECTACQVCHSPALQTMPMVFTGASQVASHIGHTAIHWASADLSHLQKPPVF